MSPEWAISDLSTWCARTNNYYFYSAKRKIPADEATIQIILFFLFFVLMLSIIEYLRYIRTFILANLYCWFPRYIEKWRSVTSIDLYKRMLHLQLSIYTLNDYCENNILLLNDIPETRIFVNFYPFRLLNCTHHDQGNTRRFVGPLSIWAEPWTLFCFMIKNIELCRLFVYFWVWLCWAWVLPSMLIAKMTWVWLNRQIHSFWVSFKLDYALWCIEIGVNRFGWIAVGFGSPYGVYGSDNYYGGSYPYGGYSDYGYGKLRIHTLYSFPKSN